MLVQAAKICAIRRRKGHDHTDFLNEDAHISPTASPKHSSPTTQAAPVVVVEPEDEPIALENVPISLARRKFDQLDEDTSGFLNQDETLYVSCALPCCDLAVRLIHADVQ